MWPLDQRRPGHLGLVTIVESHPQPVAAALESALQQDAQEMCAHQKVREGLMETPPELVF